MPGMHESIKLDSDFNSYLQQCKLYDQLSSAIAVVDTQGTLQYANPAFIEFNKAVRDSIENLPRYDSLLECPEILNFLQTLLTNSQPVSLHHRFFYSSKIQVKLTLCASPLLTPDDNIAGALLTLGEESIAFDNRHLARSQDTRLNLAERIKTLDRQKIDLQNLVNILLKNAPVPMVVFNEQRDIIQINQAAAKLFKIHIGSVRGKQCGQVFPCFNSFGCCPITDLDQSIQNELFEMDTNGSTITMRRSVTVLPNTNGETLVIEAFVDITENIAEERKRIEYEKELEALNHELEERVIRRTAQLDDALEKANQANIAITHLAAHDPLTGLFNRRRFEEELDHWGRHSLRYDRPCALMFIDLDEFKPINDQYGHPAGDQCLLEISTTLKKNLRSTDYLGRWGGDEFVVLLPETNKAATQVIAKKLLKACADTEINIADQPIQISISIGIAVIPDHTSKTCELVEFADTALYQAKQDGRGRYRLYHR